MEHTIIRTTRTYETPGGMVYRYLEGELDWSAWRTAEGMR